MSIQRASHIGICVSDIERSRRFYREALGFEELARLELCNDATGKLLQIPGADVALAFLERDGLRLELIGFARPDLVGGTGPRPMNQRGFTHLALRVDDLDGTIDRLRRAGAGAARGHAGRAPGGPFARGDPARSGRHPHRARRVAGRSLPSARRARALRGCRDRGACMLPGQRPGRYPMEDRITPALYLEMTDRDAESYVADRLGEVLALRGIERATWWANERPGRTDFPRSIPEFKTLVLYEATEDFKPPERPDDIGGLHFRHYPRPAQGNLSGNPTLGLEMVMFSVRTPERAQELRDWSDFVHLRHIAAAGVEGFTMITPHENAGPGEPRFMHLYEMDTPEAEEAFQRMVPTTERRRVGERGSPLWNEWFFHDEAVINYVNTFRRIGARVA